MRIKNLLLHLALTLPVTAQTQVWPTPSIQVTEGSGRSYIKVTIPQGVTPGTNFYTTFFQLSAVSNGVFDPTYDSCQFMWSRYSHTAGVVTGAVTVFNDSPFLNYSNGYPWSPWTNQAPSHTAENSQCKIDAAEMAPATEASNGDLVVTIPVQAKAIMEGNYSIYLQRGDWNRGMPYASDGWSNFNQFVTNWKPRTTMPNLPTKTVQPTSGSGTNPA